VGKTMPFAPSVITIFIGAVSHSEMGGFLGAISSRRILRSANEPLEPLLGEKNG